MAEKYYNPNHFQTMEGNFLLVNQSQAEGKNKNVLVGVKGKNYLRQERSPGFKMPPFPYAKMRQGSLPNRAISSDTWLAENGYKKTTLWVRVKNKSNGGF